MFTAFAYAAHTAIVGFGAYFIGTEVVSDIKDIMSVSKNSKTMTEEEAKNIIVRAMRFHRRRFVNAVLANERGGLSDKMLVAMEVIYDIYAKDTKLTCSIDSYVRYNCCSMLEYDSSISEERRNELIAIVKQQCEPGCAKRKVFKVFMTNLTHDEIDDYKAERYNENCMFDNGDLPKLW